MKPGITLALGVCATAVLAVPGRATGQAGPAPGPAGYVDFSLKTLSILKTSEIQSGRDLVARQIGLMSPDQQIAITSNLLMKLDSPDRATIFNAAIILSLYPASWSTNSTETDSKALYSKYLGEKDTSLKSAFDGALANAKGLYRDGIRDFVIPKIENLKRSEGKLRNMASNYPKSLYAENASFYTAMALVNQYILLDPKGQNGDPGSRALVTASNQAFERYLDQVKHNELPKRDFYAAGYFYRGLNSWILKNNGDAVAWMRRGADAFSDDDSIYVYQLILSPGVRSAVIDRRLPARSTFKAAIEFLTKKPAPVYPNIDSLTLSLVSF